MKTEVSAGGLILQNTRGVWEVLLVRDMSDRWTFPKGLVEESETLEETARREIREEVGLTDLTMISELPGISYVYQKDGLRRKRVHYFIFTLSKQQKLVAQTEEGIHNPTWIEIGKAIEIIGYARTNKPLLIKAKQWTLHSHRT